MKRIINFIILFLVLHIGNMVAPERIVTTSWKETLIAAVICMVFEVLLSCALYAFLGIGMVAISRTMSVLMLILIVAAVILAALILPGIGLYLTDYVREGFAIHGILTYGVLIVVLNLLAYSDKPSQSKKE